MEKSDDHVSRALGVVKEFLRERGRESGANIGHELRRQFPEFSPHRAGFSSLSHFLREAADEIVVVEQKGNDRIWALGETVSDRDLEHALEADVKENAAPENLAAVLRISFNNFRSCRRVDLDLATSGLTVLVGPNSSGKTTLLSGASYISQVTRGKLGALFSGRRDVRRLRSDGATAAMTLSISARGGAELRLSAEPDDEENARFTVSSRPSADVQFSPRTPEDPHSVPLRERPESRLFWPSVFLSFRAEALAEPSDVVEGEPRLGFDGAGLPTFLAHLATTDPARLRAVVEGVRGLVPSVEDTRQTLRRWEPTWTEARGEREPITFKYALEVKMGGSWVPADMLSEGTLLAFGVHAALNQRRPPRLLLMDDIDRGLHPKAQRALIHQLKKAAEGVQIITSTHSPYILDEIPPEAVRVVRAGVNGTRVRALTEHPEWQEWKSSMTSGEFWMYVGDDWLEQEQ